MLMDFLAKKSSAWRCGGLLAYSEFPEDSRTTVQWNDDQWAQHYSRFNHKKPCNLRKYPVWREPAFVAREQSVDVARSEKQAPDVKPALCDASTQTDQLEQQPAAVQTEPLTEDTNPPEHWELI